MIGGMQVQKSSSAMSEIDFWGCLWGMVEGWWDRWIIEQVWSLMMRALGSW